MSTTERGWVSVSRRRFLQQAGVAAAGSVVSVGALARTADSDATGVPGRALHVGLVVPESSRFAGNRQRLEQGLRFGLATRTQAGALADVTVMRVPASVTSAAVSGYEQLADRGVDAVVSLISVGGAALHAHAVRERGVPLVVVNAGTDVVRAHESTDGIYHASFDQWHAELALGQWAVRTHGERGALLTSAYEGGYDAPFAFLRGVETTGGQAPQWIGRVTDGAAEMARQLNEIAAARPAFVYAAYAGHQTQEFVTAWNASGLAGRVPLLVSGFMAQEPAVAQSPALRGVQAAVCWTPDLNTEASREFVDQYRRHYGERPDAFAALGHEAALLLAQQELAGARFLALGGEARMDDAGMLRRRAWRIAIHEGGPRVEGALDATTGSALAVLDEGPRTGLITPYLCA
jgi:ABC-type branched-subunit amino acid transport system substrate-binding protein